MDNIQTENQASFPEKEDMVKTSYSTAFESLHAENKTPKAAGLSKQDAMEFETKECIKALHAALSNESTDKGDYYLTIRSHIQLLVSSINTMNTMYA